MYQRDDLEPCVVAYLVFQFLQVRHRSVAHCAGFNLIWHKIRRTHRLHCSLQWLQIYNQSKQCQQLAHLLLLSMINYLSNGTAANRTMSCYYK